MFVRSKRRGPWSRPARYRVDLEGYGTTASISAGTPRARWCHGPPVISTALPPSRPTGRPRGNQRLGGVANAVGLHHP